MPAEKTAAIEDLASHARGLKSFAAGLRIGERQRRRDGLFCFNCDRPQLSIGHKPYTVSIRPVRVISGRLGNLDWMSVLAPKADFNFGATKYPTHRRRRVTNTHH